MSEQEFSQQDLQLLNSNRAIKYMMQAKGGKVDPKKALRFAKGELEIEKYQIELIKLQHWVINNNKRVCILFEGRDAAGKGGAIRRVTHHLNPRYYRVVALPKPNEVEKGQWYFQRYIQYLPDPGFITFFDRSWYNRAVVEPVNGFCTDDQYDRFMNEVNPFEDMITGGDLILLKFYISINKKEQLNRFTEIKANPLKRWKMTPVDERAQDLWEQYTYYKEQMFEKTHTEKNPWIIIEANRKTSARIKVMKHILKSIPYKE